MMSSKKTKSSIAAEEQAKDDPWRSGRARWNIRQFRRGRDRRWHFPGQQPDEEVRLVVRRHKIFLVKPALPWIGSLLALSLAIWADIRTPQLQALWTVVEVVLACVVLITFVFFIWRDFVTWWLETYIITNKRII